MFMMGREKELIQKLEHECNKPEPTILGDCSDEMAVMTCCSQSATLEDMLLQKEQFILDGGYGGQSDIRFEWWERREGDAS